MNKVPFQEKRKLLLLHGPALTSSRAKLLQIKKEFDPQEVVVFEGEYDLGQIKANLMTPSLFSEQRLVILENPPEDFVFDLSLITNHPSLILWFDHEVSDKRLVMEWVKKENGELFFFPEAREVSVFPLLDYLALGDKKAFKELDKLKKAGFDVQYTITMIFYLLRSLVATPKNAPRFVSDKLERQRARFSKEHTELLYQDVLEIDFKIKSGLLETQQAEFLLINLFTY